MLLNRYSSFAGCCLRNKSARWSAGAWLRSFCTGLPNVYLNLFLFHEVYACDGFPMACNWEMWPMRGGLVVLAEAMLSLLLGA